MLSLWDATYIVCDVETTGSDPRSDRIIEIACVVVRSGEISQRIHTLINPHRFIPPFITQLTGISNADVASAPEEWDVMPIIARLFSQPDVVFVAHQEQFDWRFISEAFRRCGIGASQVPRLCTLRLARRLLPSTYKKNLGALAEYFGVRLTERHRAMGDAAATAEILLHLLEYAESRGLNTLEAVLRFQHQPLPSEKLPLHLLKAVEPFLEALPARPGIYLMRDERRELLYVGKAKSLADRVRSYFQPSAMLPAHIERMVRQVRFIEWEETPTELSALLLEYQRIRQWQPPFNIMHRRGRQYPLLRLTDDEFPRIELVTYHNGRGEYFGPFPHRSIAEELISVIDESFRLRRCSGTLEPSVQQRPCFYYHLRRCGAPCAGLQSAEEYAQEVQQVRQLLTGNVQALIETLEQQMNDAAEQLAFEQAARLHRRIRQLRQIAHWMPNGSVSLTHFNVGLIVPTVYEAATAELFLILRGKLVAQRVVGRRSSLQWLIPILEGMEASYDELSSIDVGLVRIIHSWMYRNPDQYSAVIVEPAQSPSAVVEALERMLVEGGCNGSVDSQQRSYVPIEEA